MSDVVVLAIVVAVLFLLGPSRAVRLVAGLWMMLRAAMG